jgi:hypothetical protein
LAVKSVANYALGGIDIYFDPIIGHASMISTDPGDTVLGQSFRTSARSLGNITTAEINPEVTYLEHFITVNGARIKDKTVATQQTISIPFTFDEIDEANLKRIFLGSNIGTSKIALMQNPLQRGSVQLYFHSTVGQDMVISIPRATLKPNGAMAFGDGSEWVTAPMQLDVEYVSTSDSWSSKPYGIINLI